MHKHLLIIFFTIMVFGNLKAQDHLEPVRSIFDIYDFQFEYYSKVRNILFEGLTDNSEIRYLVMPSFSGENVLDISKDQKNFKYFIHHHIAEQSIWYSQNDEKEVKVKVKKIKKEISERDVELIKLLFQKAVSTSRYPDKKTYGLDGTTYYFFTSRKSGAIWSPDSGSKMSRLVEIGYDIIDFSKNDSQNLSEEIVRKIELLIKEL